MQEVRERHIEVVNIKYVREIYMLLGVAFLLLSIMTFTELFTIMNNENIIIKVVFVYILFTFIFFYGYTIKFLRELDKIEREEKEKEVKLENIELKNLVFKEIKYAKSREEKIIELLDNKKDKMEGKEK